MLSDAGAPVLVTQQALLERLPVARPPRVRLDADGPLIARQPATAPAVTLDPRNPAYVIYTSGSTGTPKAVVVEHASLASKVVTLGEQFGVDRKFPIRDADFLLVRRVDRADASAVCWRRRCRRHQRRGSRVAHRGCGASFDRHAVTFMSCVPSYLESVLPQAPEGLALRHLALGGEAFSLEFKDRIARASLPAAQITNLYGPTEATIDAISHRGRTPTSPVRTSRSADRCRTIGPTCWTPVLSLFRAGVVGELYIAGLGLARGYLNRAGLTVGAVHRRPARGAGIADVPDRGPGAVARGRGAGVPGAGGRAGEAARVPDRAWRDRGGAASAGGCVCGGGDCARAGGAAANSAWWVTWCRRREPCRTWRSFVRRCPAALPDYMVPSAFVVLERSAADHRTASSTAGRCLRRRRVRRGSTGRRARPRRRCCARCLPRCFGSGVWVSTTTSSSLAATRCWRRG